MAAPNSKATLKEYALRQLGKPVIDINVDDDQIDDIIDDALQYFAEYHYDGTIRTYLKHQINDNDLANQKADASMSQSTTGSHISSNMTFKEGQGYVVLPESVYSVLRVFPFVDKSGLNMFDLRYQLRLNDLYDISSTSIIQYEMVQNHIQLLDEILIGQVPIRFNKAQNRLYLDMDWSNAVTSGEYIIIDCYRKIDPTQFTDVYNDVWLKKYVTALIKRQWGTNLSKFDGIQLPGGVTLQGRQILEDANAEIEKLEEQSNLLQTESAIMMG